MDWIRLEEISYSRVATGDFFYIPSNGIGMFDKSEINETIHLIRSNQSGVLLNPSLLVLM